MRILFIISFSMITTVLSAQFYQRAESVEYDASKNRWLVANGTNILERSANGSLRVFGSGSGSHGMEVMGDYVFVCDGGDRIKAYDLETEELKMDLRINGASFLNGLTNDGNNTLYATDFSNRRIYKINVSDLDNPATTLLVSNTGVTPNGILYDGENNRLLWVSWGSNASVRAVDLSDNSLSIVQPTTFSNIDGIDEDNDQNYYISSWSPAQITQYDKNFSQAGVTITTPALRSPADIGYSKETDTLAIPMGNNVLYIGLGVSTSVDAITSAAFQLSLSPNPYSEQSIISFELPKSQNVDLKILDINGKFIRQLLEGTQPAGQHQVVLAGIPLASGIYICQLNTKSGIGQFKFIVP